MPQVMVSMPHYGPSLGHLRKAVQSVLDQSHRDLILVVTNDGGEEPWKALEDISDPRLIRFTLPHNRGRYYCDAVTLTAANTQWWVPHDSDDWSEPSRIYSLLARATVKRNTQLVLGGWTQQQNGAPPRKHLPRTQLSRRLRHLTHHTCLWSVNGLRAIGGPHPAWRIAYDTLMVALGVRHLQWQASNNCGYYHVERSDSLSRSSTTGIGSDLRKQVWKVRQELWEKIRDTSLIKIPDLLDIPPALQAEVAVDAERLKILLP